MHSLFFLPCCFTPNNKRQGRSRLSSYRDWAGQIKLNGFWQFHTGDDPRWASPSFDDSAGNRSIVQQTLGAARGIPGYTGFAWYRRHLEISLASGTNTTYALLIPPVDDAYEVYWNGKLIGGYGKLPPAAALVLRPLSHAFAVPSPESGTIAIRVWKSPLLFVDPGTLGGMKAAAHTG